MSNSIIVYINCKFVTPYNKFKIKNNNTTIFWHTNYKCTYLTLSRLTVLYSTWRFIPFIHA